MHYVHLLFTKRKYTRSCNITQTHFQQCLNHLTDYKLLYRLSKSYKGHVNICLPRRDS